MFYATSNLTFSLILHMSGSFATNACYNIIYMCSLYTYMTVYIIHVMSVHVPVYDAVSTAECLSTAALLARREAVLLEKKAAIADIASSVVEAPEDNVSHSNCCPPNDVVFVPPPPPPVPDISAAAAVGDVQ